MLIEIEEKHTRKPVEETINFVRSLNYEAYVYNNNKLISYNDQSNGKEINYIFINK